MTTQALIGQTLRENGLEGTPQYVRLVPRADIRRIRIGRGLGSAVSFQAHRYKKSVRPGGADG